MFDDMHTLFLKSDFAECDVFRRTIIKADDINTFYDQNTTSLTLKGLLIDIQHRQGTRKKTEGGWYDLTKYVGYTIKTQQNQLNKGDYLKTPEGKNYEIIDIIDRRSYLLLDLEEVNIDGE